jgi:hypothetical protein
MTANHQYIHFPIPGYLAYFLSHKLRNPITVDGDCSVLKLDRYSFFGNVILSSLEPTELLPQKQLSGIYLQVSNFNADHSPGNPRGHRKFLTISPVRVAKISEMLKDDFDEALIEFVEGAEFAHIYNGWNPTAKRNGIRKLAILKFCEDRGLDTEKRSVEALFKMYQRYIKNKSRMNHKLLRKLGVSMSF